ncbi:MAG: hypothetical protein U0003_05770 [Vampirovibrionales bacterium]
MSPSFAPHNEPESIWYQQFPAVESMFETMAKLPLSYQVLIAQQINQGIARYHKDMQSRPGEEPLKSLGASLVMDMMRYRNLPLWFNKDACIHQAIMHLPHVSAHTQRDLLYRVKISLDTINAFLKQCQEQQQKPDERSVGTLVESVFSRSGEDIRQLVQRGR